MITAIVLAAGESRRMGVQKVLLPYGQTTIAEHIICVLNNGGADEIIVVTGHEGDRVRSSLLHTRARFAANKDYLTGMLSSVRCGIRIASCRTKAFLIALGDQPSIQSETINALVHELKGQIRTARAILVPTHDGRRGHPMIFTHHFRDAVLTRFDDVGLHGLLTTYPELVREIPVPRPEILRDMDYPADYARELDALVDAPPSWIHQSST